ncbi:fungal specific transcription factor domain-containing protein [Rutstroemia sp. NJR-2017a BBW]|nr:fungal specific transcription factor domain-containing protein [Rutstroemia sp. NJR-2017a BBW]
MDTADLFRQALGSVNRAREAKSSHARESSHESEDNSPRIAHTLTACCRCRQRKTRCDPNLPKCLPCERAGAICEYFDTTKGKRISRTYVIRLQDKVRALEAELSQLVEEEGDTEDIVRPGGLVRLHEDDETPRFLGPSSGIAMTRIVMEEAKKYTDTRSIRELVPEVRQRRTPAQSPDTAMERKKSYPMISAVPAPTLPSRLVTDKLVEVFNQKAQYMLPTLHEPTFSKDLQDVYDGCNDPYKNFVLRMVLAISMQKLDTQYAGLADSYYLAAMSYIEDVIRPKDIKTLQCLVLIAQYSMLTPTRTAVYYIVGLATRLCQQLGLAEEKTISQGVSLGMVNPLQLDMRRRLSWIVLSMEFGLAHSMGRPNGFATGKDHLDLGFFETVDDEYITADGILPGPVSEKKRVSIHFLRMRLLQAEIRRMLYLRKRSEPQNEDHPWYAEMMQKLRDWVDRSPETPNWSKPWFNGRYNTMIVFLFRPSPQVPHPSFRSAMKCYDAAASNIVSQHASVKASMVDITWPFLLSLFMTINTILWSISYPEVRSLHSKEEIEDHIETALDTIAHLDMSLTKYRSKYRRSNITTLYLLFSPHSDQIPSSSGQSDRRFSYFPPDFTQPSSYPMNWNPGPAPPHPHPQSQMQVQTSLPPIQHPLATDSSYFNQPEYYSFPPHLFSEQGYDMGLRSGSLSQEQQMELMHSLETDGLTEIDNFMNHTMQFDHPIKFER